MEIVHIVLGKANPERMNGVNKVVYQLATKQHENGVNVSVWGITKDMSLNYGERKFKTVLFKKKLNPFSIPDDLKEAILNKGSLATYHIHGGWIPLFSSLAKFMASFNIRFVYTPHGAYNTIAMKRSWLIKKIYLGVFERFILKNASKIHCIGESEVEGLQTIYKTNKTFLLPYGYQSDFHKTPFLKNEKMIAGYMGRLDIYTKGLDILLEAFKKFQEKYPNSELWIVGDGPERNKLIKEVQNLGLKNSVVFWGSKFGFEKEELIKQMNVFVHPSRNEGLPSSILEASSLGVPCIVSKATNVSQHVEFYNSGIILKNNNAKDLNLALEEMYLMSSKEVFHEIRCNAQRLVRNVFSWNLLIDKYSLLYNVE